MFRDAVDIGLAADPRASETLDLQLGLAGQLNTVPDTCEEAYELLISLVSHIEEQIEEALLDRRLGDVIGRWVRLFGSLNVRIRPIAPFRSTSEN